MGEGIAESHHGHPPVELRLSMGLGSDAEWASHHTLDEVRETCVAWSLAVVPGVMKAPA